MIRKATITILLLPFLTLAAFYGYSNGYEIIKTYSYGIYQSGTFLDTKDVKSSSPYAVEVVAIILSNQDNKENKVILAAPVAGDIIFTRPDCNISNGKLTVNLTIPKGNDITVMIVGRNLSVGLPTVIPATEKVMDEKKSDETATLLEVANDKETTIEVPLPQPTQLQKDSLSPGEQRLLLNIRNAITGAIAVVMLVIIAATVQFFFSKDEEKKEYGKRKIYIENRFEPEMVGKEENEFSQYKYESEIQNFE